MLDRRVFHIRCQKRQRNNQKRSVSVRLILKSKLTRAMEAAVAFATTKLNVCDALKEEKDSRWLIKGLWRFQRKKCSHFWLNLFADVSHVRNALIPIVSTAHTHHRLEDVLTGTKNSEGDSNEQGNKSLITVVWGEMSVLSLWKLIILKILCRFLLKKVYEVCWIQKPNLWMIPKIELETYQARL